MEEITAILVDDEVFNLKGLQQKLTKLFPNIVIVGAFQKPEDAVDYLNKETPDLVFLDIHMPRIDGFDLLTSLHSINFEVIFITAYNNYAIKAFQYHAMGYVLKPIDNEELKIAVENALKNINQKNNLSKNNALLELLTAKNGAKNKLIIPTSKGMSFIQFDKIIYLEGYDGYTKIHLTDTTEIVSSYNIGRYEKMVSKNFYKCHKSYIINLQKVSAFENEGYIILEDEKRVPVSKTKRKEFINLFSK